MKIVQAKYPLVDFSTRYNALHNDNFRKSLLEKIYESPYDDDHELAKEYEQFIDDIANTDNIPKYFIAKTVSDYLIDHNKAIMTKLWRFLPDLPNGIGMILWQDWIYFYRKLMREKEGVVLYMTASSDVAELGAVIKTKEDTGYVRGTPPQQSKAAAVGFAMSTLFLPFLSFAKCETKVVNAEKTHKTKLNNENYITDIKTDIEIVDSNWFTTLIRTQAFSVSGHFRLQPIGMGRSERKLIWIKDFEKHGYTKRSKIARMKKEAL